HLVPPPFPRRRSPDLVPPTRAPARPRTAPPSPAWTGTGPVGFTGPRSARTGAGEVPAAPPRRGSEAAPALPRREAAGGERGLAAAPGACRAGPAPAPPSRCRHAPWAAR